MTETMASAEQQENPYPDAIGFGFAEMAALLNLAPGAAATASAAALRIKDEATDTRMVAAGASSLVARGLAVADPDGVLSVSGPVAAVTHALTSAIRRVELSLLAPDSSDSVLLVESADAAILLQPRSHLTWFAMAQRPDLDAAETTFFIVRTHVDAHPDGGVIVRNLETPEADELLIKRTDAAWVVARKVPGVNALDTESGLLDHDVLDRIRAVRQEQGH